MDDKIIIMGRNFELTNRLIFLLRTDTVKRRNWRNAEFFGGTRKFQASHDFLNFEVKMKRNGRIKII